jgi:hypothetical protein
MSIDEKLDLCLKSIELEESGKIEEAETVLRQIPLPPHLAKAVKNIYGTDLLIDGGYDLSEAEEEYGKNWLK